jgi:hypothetical protein
LQVSKKPDLRFVVGSQFFNQNPVNAEVGRGSVFPSRIKVKRRDGDGVGSGADGRVVVGQVRIPNCVKGVSDLRFGDLGRVRRLGEREGGEKGEGEQAEGQAGGVSPRESLSLAVAFALSIAVIFAISVASQRWARWRCYDATAEVGCQEGGKGVRTRQCEGRKAWECHGCR